MGTKTISLDEEAYERLKAHEREAESLSTVVKRLAGERSWLEVTGIWAGETDDLETTVEEGRKRNRLRREESTKNWSDRGHQFPHRSSQR
jgi:predicted CopG family antitoxin